MASCPQEGGDDRLNESDGQAQAENVQIRWTTGLEGCPREDSSTPSSATHFGFGWTFWVESTGWSILGGNFWVKNSG